MKSYTDTKEYRAWRVRRLFSVIKTALGHVLVTVKRSKPSRAMRRKLKGY